MTELPVSEDKDLDHAYDGGSDTPPTRDLRPLERELVVRVISDVIHHLHRNLGALTSLDAVPIRLYDQDEYNILVNVRNVIDPRRDPVTGEIP